MQSTRNFGDFCFKSVHSCISCFNIHPAHRILAVLGSYHSSVLQQQTRIFLISADLNTNK